MGSFFDAAQANLLSPMVLFFVLGFAASMARSDLSIPDQVAKAVALYLMLAIGFKGGHAVSQNGLDAALGLTALAGIFLGLLIPLIAFAILTRVLTLGRIDAAAVAAHYGSISIVTFVAATEILKTAGVAYEGWIVAIMAIMETPAIAIALLLARSGGVNRDPLFSREMVREVFLNGSVVLLMGAFAIGWATGEKGWTAISPFIDAPYKGVLCFFLLDMGLVAAARLRTARALTPGLAAFALYMPLVSAGLGMAASVALRLDPGTAALFITLCASSSYIAAPAAVRLSLPKANPAIYVTLSLAITFPFNLVFGIPLYRVMAEWAVGAAP
jgi:uncharacterized protein